MNRRTTVLLTAGITGIAVISAKRVSEGRSAERVPYEVVDRLDGVELRSYPRTLLIETTAADERTAFGRLFRYLSGANDASEDVNMTAPVRTDDGRGGVEIPMTAPVRTDDGTENAEVTMAFYLPAAYDSASAPVPTDPSVRLVVEPARTLAVASFSWYATSSRTERVATRLEETLNESGISPTGEPFLLRYDPPLTPPFLRTNEVAVDIEEP